jgi:hypothetical protein
VRSTLEIIVAVKESQPVTETELRLALLALSSVGHFVEAELRSLADAVTADKPSAKMRAKFALETLERMFLACKKAPDEWLGPGGIPGNPEHDQRLKAGKALFKAATGQDL